jgi:hypothetical protein
MMESSSKYPLHQLTLIKQKRLDEAEKVLREKKEALEKEEEKLRAVEKERDEVKEHRQAKLNQLRESMDTGAPSDKIQQMKSYLKLVDEKLKIKEQKVKEQLKAVDQAQKQLDAARADLIKKQQAVEKMRIHHDEWKKEQKAIEEHLDNVETDELGSTLHERQRRNKKHNT